MRASHVIVIGTGRFACECLDACLGQAPSLECIEPETPGFPTLASWCARRAVRYRRIVDRGALREVLHGCEPRTLVVSAYNSFIFPRSVLEHAALDIVNFHNSLLPRHRGRNAPTWTIFEMDRVTGITWSRVSPDIDLGAVVCQRPIDVPPGITAIDLTQKTLDLGVEAFRAILPSLLDGNYSLAPGAPSDGGTLHRLADVPNDGVLDLGWTVARAHAFLRSLDYGKIQVFPPASVALLGRRWSVVSYEAGPGGAGSADVGRADVQGNLLTLRDGDMSLTIRCRPR
jgi:methionyl-tRNA formyltransferase